VPVCIAWFVAFSLSLSEKMSEIQDDRLHQSFSTTRSIFGKRHNVTPQPRVSDPYHLYLSLGHADMSQSLFDGIPVRRGEEEDGLSPRDGQLAGQQSHRRRSACRGGDCPQVSYLPMARRKPPLLIVWIQSLSGVCVENLRYGCRGSGYRARAGGSAVDQAYDQCLDLLVVCQYRLDFCTYR